MHKIKTVVVGAGANQHVRRKGWALKEQTRDGELVSPTKYVHIAEKQLVALHPEVSRLRGDIFHLSTGLAEGVHM